MIACLWLPPLLDTRPLLPRLADFSAAVEVASYQPETCLYLDLANLANTRPVELLDQLNLAVLQTVRQPASLGLAGGKFPARIAAVSLGAGRALVISPGCEADFLRPLPIELLPLEEGLARQFRLLGLTTLGQLADLPPGAVLNRFGRQGQQLQQLARGQDERPVLPYRPPLTEALNRQFEPPLSDRVQLSEALQQLLASVTARMQANHYLCQTIQLELRWVDPPAVSLAVTMRQPTNRVDKLQAVLQARLSRTVLAAGGVEEMTVTLSDLQPARGEQPQLFGAALAETQIRRLRQHLPHLLTHFGPGRLLTVELTRPEAYLPEQRFRLRELDES